MEKETLLGTENNEREGEVLTKKRRIFVGVVFTLILLGIISFFIEGDTNSYYISDDDGGDCPYNNYTITTCNDPEDPVLQGADVVAYFDDENDDAIIGSSEYSSTYRGYLFYFIDEINQSIFDEDPHAFAPKYGGFCSFGLSGEDPRNDVKYLTQLSTVPADIDTYAIVGERLYMFRGSGAKDLFLESFDDLSTNADDLWESWFGESCDGYYDTGCFK
mmetsp:Transcript_16843/g.21863  ORF Transcript_16843/g.21863 Transcript_16843/m.21863 type:complete len:218 (-) Transcript_16843:284-937(-)|eukprot:CAMPEP_0114365224 /NCGR_PEP_ID=MMETSP0101-20121206/28224_1 /TAXON_ID=38822 ORGANISM="Pteridomonas danica, Strain PT" /NCGR_SAMPLE_ID=MMETSP0101 /ASSEMBLY_ACC=CAM_ASM_000211 /LENGTH=217 /DNA_ID=CAMNT_0001513395 /DNA_START=12 /DNA_END=665 /DNA_ORIENTATION=+